MPLLQILQLGSCTAVNISPSVDLMNEVMLLHVREAQIVDTNRQGAVTLAMAVQNP